MAAILPLLEYNPSSQNQRVQSFGKADQNEDTPLVYCVENISDETDWQELIWASYRQVFSEHVILDSYRQPFAESQLKFGMITVKEFIRALAKSEVFYRLVVETNSNYRLVNICLQRLLGRPAYNKREEIAWSIVIAQKGIGGFVDALLDSEEYNSNFGDNTVPYQRKRMGAGLEGRPFNLVTPRYDADYRDRAEITKYDWQFTLQKFFTEKAKTRRLPEGDPRKYQDLARAIAPKRAYPQSVRASNIPDFLAAVPYRGRR
ncbi:MAG: phycobilisome rod-core linker polypeptide [Pseudanabaenaceae cyanobacterium]